MGIRSVVTAVGLAAAAFALPAAAQNTGWYIGYNAGQSKYGLNCPSGGTCSENGAGFTIYGGRALSQNIAMEFGYSDMGKSTFGSSNVRANIWHFTGVGSWWFGSRQQLGVYGRLGGYTGELKATAPSTGAETSHGTTNLVYGVGGQWNLSSKLGTRLEWTRYAGMGGGGFSQTADVDLISLGILYKF